MSSATTSQRAVTSAAASTRGKRASSSILAGVVLIAIVSFVIYFPALRGGFILDDEDLLQRCGDAGLQKIWCSTTLPDYWPLTQSMLCLEWKAWGNNTPGYHLINLGLHFVSTLLLWRILRLLAIPGAFVAALLFAVHPVNVESVAWIAQRKNTLAMLFFLLSAYAYLRSDGFGARPNKRLYAVSLVCFVFALLSKVSVAILPPLLLLIVWWRRGVARKDILKIAPYFAIALVVGMVNVWFMSHANAEGVRTVTFAQRICGAGAVVWFYLYKAIVPLDLAFIYPKWDVDVKNWIWIAPIIFCAATTVVLWLTRQSKIGRALFVGWMFFVIALLPVMGLSDTGFMRYSLVADHYQHIAIIAVCAALGAMVSRITTYKLQIATVVIIAGVLTVKATTQATIYRDPVTLYRAAVVKNPQSWMLHGNLADELLAAGKVDEAIPQFRETLRLNPQSDDAHYFYSKALEKIGDVDGAIVELKAVTQLPVEHYQFDSYHELAMIYLSRGDKQQALAMEESAKAIVVKHGLDQVAAQSEAWMKANGLK